ncbi:carbohydrate esterase family 12 protein [Botryobasidium botryosum FD-172 SS1]|uniref:Carbohydrate esterase family 12 protein n=1 Tax=Botryobasidium botryosum (strain FD-172 SS1) TaxID=930990 RepID=A0A067MWJ0_BOTB1|nr:carbohydrate esterase family 12 protein [Botryobasidium botryosum FD-172 SS1]
MYSRCRIDGATTGTFVDGGYWALVLKDIKEQVAAKRETWVTIQFGHNDQKIAPPESMGTNITSFVRQIRQLGAQPILITSLSRRSFTNGGKISDTLGPWADETIRVAAAEKTHLLDLHKYSIQYLESIGPDAAYRLNKSPTDYTHLNTNGTIVFGR